MKKNPLADAIRARIEAEPERIEAEPTTTPAEPERIEATPEPEKPEKKAKRFHTTLYLDPEFYRRVKIALIEEGADRDFNRLVNDLIREWYAGRDRS